MNTTLAKRKNGEQSSLFFEDTFPSLFNFDFLSTPPIQSYVDVKYNDDNITLSLNLAGTPKENISIEVVENKIKIESISNDREIKKSYRLPENVDVENINANYENGILYVVLPTPVKVKNSRKISIK